MDKGLLLVAGSVVFKRTTTDRMWFLVKHETDSAWEFPRSSVRKGESSVRTALRIMGERAGMKTKVIEEAGRHNSTSTINGKVVSQRHIYYLMIQKGMEGEAIGFVEDIWLPYEKALRKLGSKREQAVLKEAHKILKEREKARAKKRKAAKS